MSSEKTQRYAANSIFPSFFLAVFGLLLIQAWVTQMGGSWRSHIILGMPGVTLSGLVFYRARLHWSAGIAGTPGWTRERPSLVPHDLPWYFLLFVAGGVIAFSSASIVLLPVVASLMYLVPWARIPVCRTSFTASSAVMLSGTIPWLSLHTQAVDPLHSVVAALMAFMPPTMMLFLVLASLPYGYRMGQATQRGGQPVSQ